MLLSTCTSFKSSLAFFSVMIIHEIYNQLWESNNVSTLSYRNNNITFHKGNLHGEFSCLKSTKMSKNETQSLTSFSSRAPRSCKRLRAARVDSSAGGSGNCSSTSYNTDRLLEFQEFPGTINVLSTNPYISLYYMYMYQ